MTHHAGLALEDCGALPPNWIVRHERGRGLRRTPSTELLSWQHDSEHTHMGVLPSAEFGALTAINARTGGSELELVVLTRDQVLLAHQAWDPEAVNDV